MFNDDRNDNKINMFNFLVNLDNFHTEFGILPVRKLEFPIVNNK